MLSDLQRLSDLSAILNLESQSSFMRQKLARSKQELEFSTAQLNEHVIRLRVLHFILIKIYFIMAGKIQSFETEGFWGFGVSGVAK